MNPDPTWRLRDGVKMTSASRFNEPIEPPANAATIDIGATVHVAAIGPDRDPEPVRSFGTFTGDLHRLADWFKQCGVSTVAMESTGVYWIPVFEILEQLGSTVVLVNARDAKHVPGRKTVACEPVLNAPLVFFANFFSLPQRHACLGRILVVQDW